MHRTLRFGTGWLLAASAAVGLSWAVITDAVDPGWLNRGGGARNTAGQAVIGGGPGGSTATMVPATSTGAATGDDTGSPSGSATGAATGGPGRPGAGGPGATAGTTSTRGHGGRATAGSPTVTGRSTRTAGGTTGTAPPPPAPTTARPATTGTTTVPVVQAGNQITTPPTGLGGYQLKGGQVVLRVATDSASLVSATPAAGYRVQTWEASGWLRVDFTSGGATSSVFVTWNGHVPTVQTVES